MKPQQLMSIFHLKAKVPRPPDDIGIASSAPSFRQDMADILDRLSSSEDALQAQFRMLQLLSDSAQCLMGYIDADARYVLVNAYYSEYFGDDRSAFEGHTVVEVHGSVVWEQIQPVFSRALSGVVVRQDVVLDYPTLGTRVMRVHLIPDVQPDGSVRGISYSSIDVAEQSRRDRELAAMHLPQGESNGPTGKE